MVTSKCPGDNGIISKNAITNGVLSTTNAAGVTSSALKAIGADGGVGAKVDPIVQKGQSPTLWDGSKDMAGKERKIVRTAGLVNTGALLYPCARRGNRGGVGGMVMG